MAMNEDSVVSSLNELRRMANDRARRETEARQRVTERSSWDQHPRRSDGRVRAVEVRGTIGGYPEAAPAAAHSPTLVGGHDAGAPAQQNGYGFAGGYGNFGYNHAAQAAAFPDIPIEPPRQKSAVGPVLLTILILGGAGGAGYWKLQQDFQAALKARDQAILVAEEGRNKAVEVAAKAEQMLKNQLAEAEQRARTAAAAVAAAPAAPAVAPEPQAAAKPAVAAKSSKADKSSKRARRPATRRVARVVLPPVEEEKKPAAAPLPKLSAKKKYSDDPLAGLKM